MDSESLKDGQSDTLSEVDTIMEFTPHINFNDPVGENSETNRAKLIAQELINILYKKPGTKLSSITNTFVDKINTLVLLVAQLEIKMKEEVNYKNNLLSLESKIEELKTQNIQTIDLEDMKKNLDNFQKEIKRNIKKIRQSSSEQQDDPTIIMDLKKEADIAKVRKNLRQIARKENLTSPKDIIFTRNNKVFIKTKTIEEANMASNVFKNNLNDLDSNNLKVSKYKKCRLIVFGLPSDLSDNEIKEEIENLEGMQSHEVEIIKKLKGKDGMSNIIFETDLKAKTILTSKKVCLSYVRTKIAPCIRILKCYNCNEIGHQSHQCNKETTCAKCAGKHKSDECISTEEKCVNCSKDFNHRSDSRLCPSFINYKKDLIRRANRI